MALSPKQLKLVHVAKRRCSLSEEQYRDLLAGEFGVTSSKSLDQKGFEKLMKRFETFGFTPMRRDGTPMDDPTPPGMMTNQQRWRLMKLVGELGTTADSDYFRGIMRQACGTERVAWLTRDAADKTINAVQGVLRRGPKTVNA